VGVLIPTYSMPLLLVLAGKKRENHTEKNRNDEPIMSAGPNPTTSEKNITNAPAHLDSDFIVESLLRTGEYHLDCDEYGGDVGIDVGIGIIGDDGGSSSAVASRFRAAARAARGYKRGEVETIRRVLEEIELIGLKRSREGLNEFNFSVGVYNCVRFGSVTMLCRCYIVTCIIISRRIHTRAVFASYSHSFVSPTFYRVPKKKIKCFRFVHL
jgi:hypothetical protein